MRVLVTGLSGLIGTALAGEIRGQHDISALNRRAVAGVPTTRASLNDLDGIRAAFVGQEVVVHLAAKIHDGVGWDALLATNVAPLILDLAHSPLVPASNEAVAITARIVDEETTGLVVTLLWRVDAVSPPVFTTTTMFDDGAMAMARPVMAFMGP